MKHIKEFESFIGDRSIYVYFSNPEAAIELKESTIYDNLDYDENVFFSESIESVTNLLEEKGFYEGKDYFLLEAQGDVKFLGLKGDVIEVEVKGHKYGHVAKENGLVIADIAKKFEKMLQFSSWKALNWLNRQTKLSFGSKKEQDTNANKLTDAPKED